MDGEEGGRECASDVKHSGSAGVGICVLCIQDGHGNHRIALSCDYGHDITMYLEIQNALINYSYYLHIFNSY